MPYRREQELCCDVRRWLCAPCRAARVHADRKFQQVDDAGVLDTAEVTREVQPALDKLHTPQISAWVPAVPSSMPCLTPFVTPAKPPGGMLQASRVEHSEQVTPTAADKNKCLQWAPADSDNSEPMHLTEGMHTRALSVSVSVTHTISLSMCVYQ